MSVVTDEAENVQLTRALFRRLCVGVLHDTFDNTNLTQLNQEGFVIIDLNYEVNDAQRDVIKKMLQPDNSFDLDNAYTVLSATEIGKGTDQMGEKKYTEAMCGLLFHIFFDGVFWTDLLNHITTIRKIHQSDIKRLSATVSYLGNDSQMDLYKFKQWLLNGVQSSEWVHERFQWYRYQTPLAESSLEAYREAIITTLRNLDDNYNQDAAIRFMLTNKILGAWLRHDTQTSENFYDDIEIAKSQLNSLINRWTSMNVEQDDKHEEVLKWITTYAKHPRSMDESFRGIPGNTRPTDDVENTVLNDMYESWANTQVDSKISGLTKFFKKEEFRSSLEFKNAVKGLKQRGTEYLSDFDNHPFYQVFAAANLCDRLLWTNTGDNLSKLKDREIWPTHILYNGKWRKIARLQFTARGNEKFANIVAAKVATSSDPPHAIRSMRPEKLTTTYADSINNLLATYRSSDRGNDLAMHHTTIKAAYNDNSVKSCWNKLQTKLPWRGSPVYHHGHVSRPIHFKQGITAKGKNIKVDYGVDDHDRGTQWARGEKNQALINKKWAKPVSDNDELDIGDKYFAWVNLCSGRTQQFHYLRRSHVGADNQPLPTHPPKDNSWMYIEKAFNYTLYKKFIQEQEQQIKQVVGNTIRTEWLQGWIGAYTAQAQTLTEDQKRTFAEMQYFDNTATADPFSLWYFSPTSYTNPLWWLYPDDPTIAIFNKLQEDLNAIFEANSKIVTAGEERGTLGLCGLHADVIAQLCLSQENPTPSSARFIANIASKEFLEMCNWIRFDQGSEFTKFQNNLWRLAWAHATQHTSGTTDAGSSTPVSAWSKWIETAPSATADVVNPSAPNVSKTIESSQVTWTALDGGKPVRVLARTGGPVVYIDLQGESIRMGYDDSASLTVCMTWSKEGLLFKMFIDNEAATVPPAADGSVEAYPTQACEILLWVTDGSSFFTQRAEIAKQDNDWVVSAGPVESYLRSNVSDMHIAILQQEQAGTLLYVQRFDGTTSKKVWLDNPIINCGKLVLSTETKDLVTFPTVTVNSTKIKLSSCGRLHETDALVQLLEKWWGECEYKADDGVHFNTLRAPYPHVHNPREVIPYINTIEEQTMIADLAFYKIQTRPIKPGQCVLYNHMLATNELRSDIYGNNSRKVEMLKDISGINHKIGELIKKYELELAQQQALQGWEQVLEQAQLEQTPEPVPGQTLLQALEQAQTQQAQIQQAQQNLWRAQQGLQQTQVIQIQQANQTKLAIAQNKLDIAKTGPERERKIKSIERLTKTVQDTLQQLRSDPAMFVQLHKDKVAIEEKIKRLDQLSATHGDLYRIYYEIHKERAADLTIKTTMWTEGRIEGRVQKVLKEQ